MGVDSGSASPGRRLYNAGVGNETITPGRIIMRLSGGYIQSEEAADTVFKVILGLVVALIAWKIFSVEPDPTHTPKDMRGVKSHENTKTQYDAPLPPR